MKMKKILSLVLAFILAVLSFSVVLASGEPQLGDINGDGNVDADDYIMLKRAYFGMATLDDAQKSVSDINSDGKIDADDYILLKRAYFGMYDINGNLGPAPEDSTDDSSFESPEIPESSENTEISDNSDISDFVEPKTIRVASYNIAHVGQYTFTDANYNAIAENILASDADVVGIQEAVCGIFGASYGNPRFTDSLARLKELTGYEYVYYLGWDDESNTAGGILSKYPITNLGSGSLTEASIESLTTASDHYFNENEKNTIANYNAPFTAGSDVLELDVNGETVRFWSAHSKPANYAVSFALLDGSEDSFIMVGDFNNPVYTDLTDFALANGTTLGSYMSLVNNEDNKLITFPRDQKFMDNILYTSDDFVLLDSGVVESESTASDHYLIWAEFQIGTN